MKSEILIQSVLKEIEIISKRISAIKNVFYQTSNLGLKKRLANEYSYLFSKFEDLKAKVILLNKQKKPYISYSSIMLEKYNRCEKLISQNSNLFFV